MNEDESTFEVPDYIQSRLQPTLRVPFPSRADEMEILRYHLPFAEEDLLTITVDFLQQAHRLDLDFSTRDGINIIRYAIKRLRSNPSHPLSRDLAWSEALVAVLGEEAHDLEQLAKKRKSNSYPAMGLSDFFFEEDDPLRPDDEP
jgi:hypothetical protein